MTAPWPCSTCGAPGVRNIFAQGLCGVHLSALFRTFKRESWGGAGIGLQAGPRRPDHGPEFVELECSACSASWVGTLLEQCAWCVAAHERMLQHQAELLLRPELPDVDDVRHKAAVTAWTERLARAVKAGIVSEDEARTALRRQVVRRVA